MDFRQVFATNLRRERLGHGLSQEELAFQADINRTYLSKLEKGASWPGLEVICKLAKVLKIEPYQLIQRPTPPTKPKRAIAS